MNRKMPLIGLLGLLLSVGTAAAMDDDDERITRLRPLAEQGDVASQAALGLLYSDGPGDADQYREAAKWLRMAAEKGDAKAQRRLAWLYTAGHGVRRDFAEAAVWNRKAAEQGDVEAQFQLGLLYGMGRGVARDPVAAYAWFDLAAGQGHEQADGSRAVMAETMSPAQIAEAENRARAWAPRR